MKRLLPPLLFLLGQCPVWSFVPKAVQEKWKTEGFNLDQAMKVIEERSVLRELEDYELYYATRFIDRNAHKLYRDPETKHKLWEKAEGSWELQMAYDDSHSQFFYPYPDFRDYAMAFVNVEMDYFGKGIAQTPAFSFVAMGGPATIDERTRQLFMDYQDFYISGNLMPEWDLSYFMRGYARQWMEREKNRPPLSFTLIGVSDKAMIVRGSKTGGMAIFKRIEDDMRPAAYGDTRR